MGTYMKIKEKYMAKNMRGGKKKKMFGCITGIPVTMSVNGKTVKMTEINFLCVHKNLRAKRLAPVPKLSSS